MAITVAEKKAMANKICEKLAEVGSYKIESDMMQSLQHGLSRLRPTVLRDLSLIVSTVFTQKKPVTFEMVDLKDAPEGLRPIDIAQPKNNDDVTEMLMHLPSITIHLLESWHTGNIADIKKWIECTNRMTKFTVEEVKNQLWNHIKE
jgi:hypothetical protein